MVVCVSSSVCTTDTTTPFSSLPYAPPPWEIKDTLMVCKCGGRTAYVERNVIFFRIIAVHYVTHNFANTKATATAEYFIYTHKHIHLHIQNDTHIFIHTKPYAFSICVITRNDVFFTLVCYAL